MNIIVDSSVIISFYDKDDSNHKKAIKTLDKYSLEGYKFWITEHILDEVANIFLKRSHIRQLKDFFRRIEKRDLLVFLPDNKIEAFTIMESTLSILLDNKKNKASYTDLYSIIVAKNKYLEKCTVVSFDKHINNFE